jgi:uridine kinase
MTTTSSPVSAGRADRLVAHALRDNPVLESLGDADLDELVAHLECITFEPGEAVIHEGQFDRSTYFVLEGTACILRGGVDLGTLERGAHFGELELIATRARAASIVAVTSLSLARLTHERYQVLSESRPRLALKLLQTFLHGLGDRLLEITESYGRMLGERAAPRRTGIEVRVCRKPTPVRTGTMVGELLPRQVDGRPVVAGLVDRKATSLLTRLTSDCDLEPLTTATEEGIRIYRKSQALLLLEAAYRQHPELSVAMSHSVGFAQRVVIGGSPAQRLGDLARELEAGMHELVAAREPLRQEWWTGDEAQEHFTQAGWHDAAALLNTWRDAAVPLVTYGKVYALNTGPLLPDAGQVGGFQVLADQGGLLLIHGPQATSRFTQSTQRGRKSIPPADPQTVIAREALAVSRQTSGMTYRQELWLDTLGVTSAGAFNDACIRGHVTEIIEVSEGFQEKRITRIADDVSSRRDSARAVCIAGPSCAGKTTFIKRLKTQLQVNGVRPVTLSLDDYYVDREVNPRDENGEYDYEAVEALQLDLLQDHVPRLLRGETVTTARYDFAAGRSLPTGGRRITLRPTDVLMLEGIHGLNPRLLPSIPEREIYRIFVCPLVQLPLDRLTRVHASDVRLLRRIIRDRHSRGTNAAQNIMRWPSVRAGERKHIFPFQHNANAVFDSSLIYELAVLKVFAERYLLEVPQSHPAYTTAFRLLQLVDRFVAIYPDHVPPTSILREFIGGSRFEY